MKKGMVEKFQNENRAVWFLGTHTAMPVKGRVAAICKAVLDKTAEIKAAVQIKDDCIRFMFTHAVADTAECTDWTACSASQKIAKEKWDLKLN